MKFQIDHDLHIHTFISGCVGHDPRQTPEAILSYGVCSDMRLLCVADHVWDEKAPSCTHTWADGGNTLTYGRSLLPLPQSKYCKFIFGVEVDIDYEGNMAVSREEMDNLDFLVFAPSHLHLKDFTVPRDLASTPEAHSAIYMKRMDELLSRDDIPWHKTGLAHPLLGVIPNDRVRMFDLIPDRQWEEMWTRVRDRGMGVEINRDPSAYTPIELEHLLRPLHIAKAVGCKFYLGSDAHMPEETRGKVRQFQYFIDLLELTEEDKLPFVIENRAPVPPTEIIR